MSSPSSTPSPAGTAPPATPATVSVSSLPSKLVVSQVVASSVTLKPAAAGGGSSSPKPEDSSLPEQGVTTKKVAAAPLKIPSVSLRPAIIPPRPVVPSVSFRSSSTPTISRQPTIMAVPKLSTGQVNLTVVQQVAPVNKVTVLQPTTSAPSAKIISTAPAGLQVPRAAATAVIRQPTAFPVTIRGPTAQASPTGTSIRLSTSGSSASASAPVQFLPVSLTTATGIPVRPSSNTISATPVTVRSAPVAFRPGLIRPNSESSNPVRVTLMQQGHVKVGQQSSTPLTSATYKPVTITTQTSAIVASSTSSSPSSSTSSSSSSSSPSTGLGGPVRIGPVATSRMTMVPAQGSSHISVPLAPSHLTSKPQPIHAKVQPGKILSVPSAGSIVSSGAVTIQKAPNVTPVTRSINLPYGTAQAVSTPSTNKAISTSAIPVARVCPQPLNVPNSNLVTISTSVDNLAPGGVYISRTPAVQQSLAINISSSGGQFGSKVGQADLSGRQASLAKISLPAQPTRLINFQTTVQSGTSVSSSNDHEVSLAGSRLPNSPSRPSILRRREGERELVLPGSFIRSPATSPRPDSRDDASSSSGSTTLSATSSPGGGAGHLSGCEDIGPPVTVTPSPRKKPRKQQLPRVREQPWSESEDGFSGDLPRKVAVKRELNLNSPPHECEDEYDGMEDFGSSYLRDKPRMSMMSSYRPSWKPRYNHFNRYSDVKAKDEKRPTINDLANQKFVLQKVDGWKVYHLATQMDAIVDMEAELTSKLCDLQKRLERSAHPELDKDVAKIQELIKANLQRSKIIRDQMTEAKEHTYEIFKHKPKIIDIIHKYESKRPVKRKA